MPSHENDRNGDYGNGYKPGGKDRRRRRRPTRESLIEKSASPIRFELPDNALAGYPPVPEPPPPISLEVPLALEASPAPTTVDGGGTRGEGSPNPTPPELGAGGRSSPFTLAAPSLIFPPVPRHMNPRLRLWVGTVLGLVVGVPIVLTLIGALTSPPHVKGIPMGHFVYLEAEAPSEKTTTLRGLYVTLPGGASRLLTHENEPQDTDGGVREWITQPTLSPDGTQLAFEKQLITLGEEKQTIQNQIWVMPLAPGRANLPRLVTDLTAGKLKQIVGLAWDSDSSLLFLEDGFEYSVPTDTPDPPLRIPLALHGLILATSPDISATRSPALTESGRFTYGVLTPTGPQTLVQDAGAVTPGPAAAVFALAPAGDRIAFIPPESQDSTGGAVIRTYDLATHGYGPDIPARWGWSVFGRRRITSLRWSPDGAQLAYTVSKPPIPEDEIFVTDVASGKTVQLPYRAGRAAWDWAK